MKPPRTSYSSCIYEKHQNSTGCKQKKYQENAPGPSARVPGSRAHVDILRCLRVFIWYKGRALVYLCVGSVVVTAASWAALDRMKHNLREIWAVMKLGGAKLARGMVIDSKCRTIAVTMNQGLRADCVC